MRDFRQLRVWEASHKLTLEIYKITIDFPKEELFALTNQMRRSASSIPTDIAEGCGRGSNKDYAKFLQIAMGSAYELDYQLLLSKDLGYIDTSKYNEINGKIDSTKRQTRRPPTKSSQNYLSKKKNQSLITNYQLPNNNGRYRRQITRKRKRKILR